MSQYVCARITAMQGIDIGLFDFDRHNALYYFVLNEEEQIYLRYGGRDAKSADTYLNLQSLELALQQGLELHEQYLRGALPTQKRPRPLFPRDIALLVDRTIERYNCVECHLIADYQTLQAEQNGSLDKLSRMYRSPDIKALGIHLDVPKGLSILKGSGAAEQAGLLPGDAILSINGTSVRTFGDFQYYLDQVPRDAKSLAILVERDGQKVETVLSLPRFWWRTDLRYRHWSIDPLVYYKSRPLSESDKERNGLNPVGFASVVTYIDPAVALLKRHELRVGDIVFAVDGVDQDELADTCVSHIKLRKEAGTSVVLSILRDGKPISLPLKTERQRFRK